MIHCKLLKTLMKNYYWYKTMSNSTTLDYIENITVSGDKFSEPCNEYWALYYIWDGMEAIYRQAYICDDIIKQKVTKDQTLQVFISGNNPKLAGISQSLLTSMFHWYAVSACQYVRTIGAIAYRQDNTRPTAIKYVEQVIPEVLVFRDKVAAHFSYNTKNNHDNSAERLISIMPNLAFDTDSFYIGSFQLAAPDITPEKIKKCSTSEKIKQWSICKVHEQLRERYKSLTPQTKHSRVEKEIACAGMTTDSTDI